MDIRSEQIVPVAQRIGAGILGIIAAFGMWWGQRRRTPAEHAVEVAGALVDSSAVKELAVGIKGLAEEQRHNRSSG